MPARGAALFWIGVALRGAVCVAGGAICDLEPRLPEPPLLLSFASAISGAINRKPAVSAAKSPASPKNLDFIQPS